MSALSPTPQERLSDARISELVPDCDLGACLPVLLRALGWRGNPRRIAEALPHFTDDLDLTALRNSMAILGYAGSPEPVGLADVDPRLMPLLYLPRDGAALVVVERTGSLVAAFDGGKGETVSLDPRGIEGEAWFFSPRQDEGARQGSWFASMIGRFRPLFAQAFLISLLINVMGFAIPIFVMSVYDKVIGAGKPDALPWLAAGAAAALAADAALRSVRARILAFIGARMNAILSTSVFERLMALPAAYTESSTIGAQIARVKDFESIREFFTGSLASVMMA